MKARLELSERELKRLMRKRLFVINFPKLEQKTYYLGLSILLGFGLMFGVLMNEWGYSKGMSVGWGNGFRSGEKSCIEKNLNDLTLEQAAAFHIKYNLPGIFLWFAVVVGIAWVFHGVGFRLA